MGGACSTNGNAYRLMVGKPEGLLGRTRCRWVDNNSADF
jgi:hypothetical protein